MGAASSILSPQGPDGRIIAPPGYVTPKFPGLYPPTLDNDAKNITRVEGQFLFRAEDVWHFTLYWCIIFHAAIFLLPAAWFTLVTLLSPTSSLTLRRSPIRKFDGNAWEQAVRRRPSQAVVGDGRTGGGGEGDRSAVRREAVARGQGDEQAVEMRSMPVDQAAGRGIARPRLLSQDEVVSSSAPEGTPLAPLGSSTSMSTLSQPAATTRRSRLSHLRFPSLSTAPLLGRRRSRITRKPSKPAQASAPIYLALLPLLFLLAWSTLSALVMGTIIGFTLSAVYTTANFEMSTWVPFLWALIETCIVVISTYSTVTTIL